MYNFSCGGKFEYRLGKGIGIGCWDLDQEIGNI